MKLTKTQQMLIDRATRNGYVQVESYSGRGAGGGFIKGGRREMRAAQQLIAAGLAVETHRDTSGVFTGNGNMVHVCCVSLRLTNLPTDEQMLQALHPCGK